MVEWELTMHLIIRPQNTMETLPSAALDVAIAPPTCKAGQSIMLSSSFYDRDAYIYRSKCVGKVHTIESLL